MTMQFTEKHLSSNPAFPFKIFVFIFMTAVAVKQFFFFQFSFPSRKGNVLRDHVFILFTVVPKLLM